MNAPLILRNASLAPGARTDLVVRDGTIGAGGTPHGDAVVVDLDGRPTLPGLADHHIHLMAQAAAWDSVDCSPPALRAAGGLRAALRDARRRRPTGWLRGVGYDVAADGPLDRHALDAFDAGPVRIQDRTGILWMLDTAALQVVLPQDDTAWPDGVERSADRQATGVLRRLDGWLRSRTGTEPPDVSAVGRWLASRGVTAVTDATATNTEDEVRMLADAGMPQRLTAMTAAADCRGASGVALGPVKVVLDEADLPALDDLTARVDEAHAAGRRVAVHCVDLASLVLALSSHVGPGDRIEHAFVVSTDVLPLLAASGVTVVTQPGLTATRGDRYLAEHDPSDYEDLHRLGSLLRSGIPVGAGSDAPYGPLDPWTAIAAAVDRRTPTGQVLGAAEAVDAHTAVRLHAGGATSPARPRTLDPGAPADIVVLDDDWGSLQQHPRVALTLLAGAPTYTTFR